MAVVVFVLWVAPASAHHGYDMDCPQFASQAAAQHHMNAHPGDPDGLDGYDGDGRACESSPCPCYYGGTTQPDADPAPPKGKRYSARIVSVIDGDTIKVRLPSGSRRTVRLIGIDTPETRKPGVPIECGARRATRYMTRSAFRHRKGRRVGHSVRLTTDPTQDTTDRYGRLLAYVTRLADGADLGKAIVRAGWAMPYVYDSSPFARFTSYEAARRKAQSRGLGVWGSCAGDFHTEQ